MGASRVSITPLPSRSTEVELRGEPDGHEAQAVVVAELGALRVEVSAALLEAELIVRLVTIEVVGRSVGMASASTGEESKLSLAKWMRWRRVSSSSRSEGSCTWAKWHFWPLMQPFRK